MFENFIEARKQKRERREECLQHLQVVQRGENRWLPTLNRLEALALNDPSEINIRNFETLELKLVEELECWENFFHINERVIEATARFKESTIRLALEYDKNMPGANAYNMSYNVGSKIGLKKLKAECQIEFSKWIDCVMFIRKIVLESGDPWNPPITPTTS